MTNFIKYAKLLYLIHWIIVFNIMELNNFFNLLKAKASTIWVFIAVFFVLGVGLTLVQPLKYSSNLRLLVVQDVSGATDPYTATRSNEYLSEILSKVAYSTTFFNQTLNAGLGVDGSYFGNTSKKISKTWSKTIDVKPISNTGIITITAYHPNREQAERIARAVGTVLITQNGNYHGLGNKVSLKLLDDPITSSFPVKPNLILNAVLALILGLIFALSFIYLFPEADLFKRWSAEKNWRQANDDLSRLNLYQEATSPADYRLVEEALPQEAAVLKNEAPKLDWYNEF